MGAQFLVHQLNASGPSVCSLLRMHHLCALLASYSACVLMSPKMQIKTSQVANGRALSRCAGRQKQGCKSDFAATPVGTLCSRAQLTTHVLR